MKARVVVELIHDGEKKPVRAVENTYQFRKVEDAVHFANMKTRPRGVERETRRA